MKTLLSFLVLCGGLLSCGKDKTPTPGNVAAAINQFFTLETNQKATLPTTSGSVVQVAVAAINDARCPSDINCFTAGFADVDVTLTDANTPPRSVRLGLGYRPTLAADSALVTLNQQDYWVRLLAVSPYPSKATASLPKTATLRLRLR